MITNQESTFNFNSNPIIKKLKSNPNNYSALEIQQLINTLQIKYSDLLQVFDSEQVEAILNFTPPTSLPISPISQEKANNIQEIYLWGTPSSGKTSLIGILLNTLNSYGLLEFQNTICTLYNEYFSNSIYQSNILKFPSSNADDSFEEIAFSILSSNKSYQYKIFDLNGGIIKPIFNKFYGFNYENYFLEKTLNKLINHINDSQCFKHHFFLVPYGEANNMFIDNHLKTAELLNTTIQYLAKQRIIKKGTKSIYILVSKCDKMPCAPHERKEMAVRYITETLPAFYNNLRIICDKAGVADFDIIPFTLGDVFAQHLCRFDPNNTNEIINIFRHMYPCTCCNHRKSIFTNLIHKIKYYIHS